MIVQHRPGIKHANADALSRIPETLEPCPVYAYGSKLKDLPCGGCPYCTRADTQWRKFSEEVDDVVPLASRTLESQGSTDPVGVNAVVESPNVSAGQEKFKDLQSNSCECTALDEYEPDVILFEDVGLQINAVNHSPIAVVVHNNQLEVQTSIVKLPVEASPNQPACWGFTFAELESEQAKDPSL